MSRVVNIGDCVHEACVATTRRKFRRPNRKRPSAVRLRMNSGRFSNNEMSAIRPGKPLKLMPRGRRCWQTLSFPFIGGYCVWPFPPSTRKRYKSRNSPIITSTATLKSLRMAWGTRASVIIDVSLIAYFIFFIYYWKEKKRNIFTGWRSYLGTGGFTFLAPIESLAVTVQQQSKEMHP